MERSKIAIIIPVFNEVKTIKKIISNLKNYGSLIIINDCSYDGTEKILKSLSHKVLKNDINLGYDLSLKKGLAYAKKKKFKYIVTTDGDGEHQAHDVKKVIGLLKQHDVIFTTRNELFRKSEKILKYFSQLLFEIEDPLSGLKGYTENALNNYTFKNWKGSYGSDLLIYAKLNRFKIGNLKIKIKKRNDNSRVGNNILVNLLMIKLIVRYFFIYLLNKTK